MINETTGMTNDLDRDEEVLLVSIALNPDKSGDEIRKTLDSDKKPFETVNFSKCVDTLLVREYVEMVDDEDSPLVWRLTELGRMALMKFKTILRFDLIYAHETGVEEEVIKNLSQEKQLFEKAHQAAKIRARQRKNSE